MKSFLSLGENFQKFAILSINFYVNFISHKNKASQGKNKSLILEAKIEIIKMVECGQLKTNIAVG